MTKHSSDTRHKTPIWILTDTYRYIYIYVSMMTNISGRIFSNFRGMGCLIIIKELHSNEINTFSI